jgi:hypothetical protein
MFPFGTFLFSSQLLIAVADTAPNLDFRNTCRNAATVSGAPTKNDIDICIADEQGARDQLVKEWAQFASIAKDRCVRASREYLPSYVELLTCLSMARDAKGLAEEKPKRPGKRPR